MNTALALSQPPQPASSGPAAQRAQRQTEVVRALAAVLPGHALLHTPEDTTPYECDGLTAYRERPLAVALPETYACARGSGLWHSEALR